MFLLFDFVHIFKSIRNNRITEEIQEPEFPDHDLIKTARWSDIVTIYKEEENNMVKMAKLTEVSVFPKPIEQQKLSTCFKIFSEETIASLKINSPTSHDDGTIRFVERIIKFWKIVNSRGPYEDVTYKDVDRAEIRSPDDPRLNVLLEIAEMADSVKKSSSANRYKKFTKDISTALAHKCRALVDLVKHLLHMIMFYSAFSKQISLKIVWITQTRVRGDLFH